MKDLIEFSFILFAAINPIIFILLWVFFKRSVVFFIGANIVVMLDAISLMAFIAGNMGMEHMVWSGPIGTIIIFIGFFLIATKVKRPLKNLTSKINYVSTGDLSVVLDEKILKRKAMI